MTIVNKPGRDALDAVCRLMGFHSPKLWLSAPMSALFKRTRFTGVHRSGLAMTFADALVALDCVVAAASEASARQTQQRQVWTAASDAVERFAHGRDVYRLSDGSTQLTYSIPDQWCALAQGASAQARNNFERALAERRAIERLVAERTRHELGYNPLLPGSCHLRFRCF
ncbi:MAG TPA: hypothetical protein VFR86_15660 [Burkholderiaceae bacterium]|nr:hypothetical protein [Burkholderiaceae bacterium]